MRETAPPTNVVVGLLAVFGLLRIFGVGGFNKSSTDLDEYNPPDNGLGGMLAVRIPPLGGCGNAFILIVFLIVFPAELTPGERTLGIGVPPITGVVGRDR